MTRTLRIILAAGALALLVVATTVAAPSDRGRERMAPVAASHQPASPGAENEPADENEEQDEDGPPSQELLDRLVGKLADAGVATDADTADTIAALAEDYGVGGAVRLLWWASAAGISSDEIAAMFDSGMGWGEIAQELNAEDGALDLHPGLGSIMGNGGGQADGAQGLGLGRAGAPGQQKRQ